MRLRIKQTNLEAYELEVENDATIESIQYKISEKSGLSIDHFRLSYYNANKKVICNQISLPPSSRLSLFDLQDLTEIHIDTVKLYTESF